MAINEEFTNTLVENMNEAANELLVEKVTAFSNEVATLIGIKPAEEITFISEVGVSNQRILVSLIPQFTYAEGSRTEFNSSLYKLYETSVKQLLDNGIKDIQDLPFLFRVK